MADIEYLFADTRQMFINSAKFNSGGDFTELRLSTGGNHWGTAPDQGLSERPGTPWEAIDISIRQKELSSDSDREASFNARRRVRA